MRPSLLRCLLAAACLLSACTPPSSPPTPTPDAGVDPADLVPALLDVDLATDGQSATVGTALPGPLTVRVVNRHDRPLAGVEVHWTLVEGTGTLEGTASTTDAEGRARMGLTLGTQAGVRRVTAHVHGLEALTLTARALPGPVARVAVTSPSPTLELERTLVLSAALADAYDNPITGQALTWTSSDEAIAVVDAAGTVLGVTTGPVRLSATSGGVSGHVDLEVVWPTNAVVFTSVALGRTHGCATLLSGGAWCWGADTDGALGNGPTDTLPKKTPSPVTMPEGVSFSRVVAGPDITCGLNEAGAAWCWGTNSYGQLGNGGTEAADVPGAVQLPEGMTLETLSLSSTHACGLAPGGEAWCWGFNYMGNLGDGTTTPSPTPVKVLRPEGVTAWRAVSAGGAYTCGVSTAGDVYCWGYNSVGQLGDGTTENHGLPAKVATAEGLLFETVQAAYDYACAVSTVGEVYCWGTNAEGQLGTGTASDTPSLSPVKVAAPEGVTFGALAGELERTCALTRTGGEVYCWGSNPRGQLGDGTQTASARPVKTLLPGGVRAAVLSAGQLATCATTTAGEAFCWGDNSNGLLGNGSNELNATTPRKVTEPPVP